ncbi:MAG: glycosyltransferase family 4 protein [Ignavibacteria bacterium]
MKKILVITYYWPPSGGAGVQRILKAVKYFPKSGIEPFVVTVKEDRAGYPSYDRSLEKDVPAEAKVFRTDTFEPFGLYSKLLGKKSIPTGFSNESNPGLFQKFSRFVRGNFFIPDARRGWLKFAFKESCRIIEKEKIDTVLVTSPPHSAQLIGYKLKKKYNIKWIADMRDPWTDIYFYNEFKHLPFAKNLDKKYEREVLENADKIITVGEHLKNQFLGKSPKIKRENIIVIPNGYDEEDFKNQTPQENLQREFVITYTGTLADSYNPIIFFTSLKKMTEKFPEAKIKLRFVGNPAMSVIGKIKDISLGKHIELIPTVNHDESIGYLLRSTMLLLVIPEIKNDKGILTGKLFEYLAARKPIICIGPEDGDAAIVIRECGAGKTFERNNEDELNKYLEEQIKNWIREKNLDVTNDSFRKYSRQNQANELSKIISSS